MKEQEKGSRSSWAPGGGTGEMVCEWVAGGSWPPFRTLTHQRTCCMYNQTYFSMQLSGMGVGGGGGGTGPFTTEI